MGKQRNQVRRPHRLALALAALVIGIVLLLGFTSVAASITHSDSRSSSSASSREIALSLNRWSSNGPDGGAVLSLAIDPGNPTAIYAGTISAVFKSTDDGGSWTSILANTYVQALVIDPKTPTTLYAAGNDGVSKSTDGGASWNLLISPKYLSRLSVAPTNPQIIYALANSHVFKSTDGGGSWSGLNNGLSQIYVYALAVDPTDANTIYGAGTQAGKAGVVIKSTNGGGSWSASYPVTPDGYVDIHALAVDPNNPNIIYAGSRLGVFKSTNGAQSWIPVNNGLPSSVVFGLAIDPTNSNTVYIIAWAWGSLVTGVFKSTDGGGSWSASSSGLPNVGMTELVINPLNPAISYVGTYGGGIFKSTNGGAGWSTVNQGLRSVNVGPLVVDPGNPNIVYAGTYGGGLLKSNDNGGGWRKLENGLTSRDIYALAIDARNPATIYAGAESLYKSTNGGESWSLFGAGLPTDNNYISALAIDFKDPNVIYAVTNYGLYKSTTGGGNWSAIGNLSYPSSPLVIDPSNSKTIYAASAYYCDLSDFCSYTMFKSTDGGVSWKRSDAGVSVSDYVSALVIDPINTTTLYASVYSYDAVATEIHNRTYKSTDSGASWSAIGTGLPNSGVSSLVINPVNPNVIFAGTFENGVFKSADGGTSWNPLNDGLTNPNINGLAIDASGNFLHAGTLAGVFDLQLAAPQAPNQIDNTQYFVQQQYRDFLSREPDPPGLNFWSENIFSCGTDPSCIEAKRINTSAAFFLSLEFQQTGYEVYRIYKAAYGTLPDTPAPITFNEFLPDSKEIGQGVIVNQSGWEQVLENNKQAFTTAFVQRPRFITAFPATMSASEFVNSLNANAGNPLSPSERDQLASDLATGMKTRAQVLRAVAEDQDMVNAEFNRAFVLMQYFGYLRRNPNDAPDTNFDGYNFWLNKLNQFNGDFVGAEMVKAFIVSREYRRRFGP